ncbi:FK506-binding protein-like [Nilaparvata lugens]|uniref:FK506-binding protein-like n=1 Tax=Nilaparvata lugens TaxID=108931 RepID=UPI00193CF695|nr:FK506-binding protein-like [Nilaparvata lugens]
MFKRPLNRSWQSRDKRIVKDILKSGEYQLERPKEGSECTVKVQMVTQNEEQQTGGQQTGGYFQSAIVCDDFDGRVVIGEADTEFDRAVEKVLQLMDKGEVSKVTVKLDTIDCSACAYVTLVDFTPSQSTYAWSKEKKMEVARRYKERGCELFKAGRILDAYLRFGRAVKLLITLGTDNETVRPLYVTLCNNMAWCQLARSQLEHALTLCNKVLEKEPDNVKALMRRAEAFTWLKDTENAVNDLTRVTELEPRNTVAHERLVTMKNRLALETVRYNNTIKKMFRF